HAVLHVLPLLRVVADVLGAVLHGHHAVAELDPQRVEELGPGRLLEVDVDDRVTRVVDVDGRMERAVLRGDVPVLSEVQHLAVDHHGEVGVPVYALPQFATFLIGVAGDDVGHRAAVIPAHRQQDTECRDGRYANDHQRDP